MVFSTIIFLFRFLPITLALYYLAPAKLKNTVLFLCSLVFYCWGEVRFFPVMVALILLNYVCGLCIERFDQRPALRKTFLLLALVGSLGMLFYFKYANFVLRSANALLGTVAGVNGLKTGWTVASGYNIVVTAQRGKTRLLAVVLGGNTKDRRDASARRLIEAGFRHPSSPKQVRHALGRRR